MNVRLLPRPDVFLQSAISNIDCTEWVAWEHGICAVYFNTVTDQDGVLCVWEETGEGFLCSVSDLRKIVSIDGAIFMLCADGFIEWDGQHEIQQTSTPMIDWHHVQLAAWGGAGFSNFRFHYWLKDTGDVVTLPMGVEKLWALGLHGEVLWSYWGQFFLKSDRVVALESIPDTMEDWVALRDDWWVAVFEETMVVWHPRYSAERIDLDDVLDVHVCSNRREVLILDVNGGITRWTTHRTMDVLLESSDADRFIGDRALLCDEEIMLIAP